MAVGSVCLTNNADLIRDVCSLYLPDGGTVADMTWGKGVFWKHTPDQIRVYSSDIEPSLCPDVVCDFRRLPFVDGSVDVAVLDPPYIHSPGKHITDSRYNNAATTKGMYHEDIMQLYFEGMQEALRIAKSQVWVKCKDQVMSGRQCWSHIEILQAAERLGMYGRDLFVLVPSSNTTTNRWKTQYHARKRHSYLWVFDTHPTNRRRKLMAIEGPDNLIEGEQQIVEDMTGPSMGTIVAHKDPAKVQWQGNVSAVVKRGVTYVIAWTEPKARITVERLDELVVK